MIENTNAAENVIDTEYAEENLQLAENQYTEEEEIEQVENEFKSKINHYTIQNENTIDSIAKKDAIENPFN